jgi:hypothetical protein
MSPTPSPPTQTESRTGVHSPTDPYPATGSTQAEIPTGRAAAGWVVSLTMFSPLTLPIPFQRVKANLVHGGW